MAGVNRPTYYRNYARKITNTKQTDLSSFKKVDFTDSLITISCKDE